jgi:hypothetical protein
VETQIPGFRPPSARRRGYRRVHQPLPPRAVEGTTLLSIRRRRGLRVVATLEIAPDVPSFPRACAVSVTACMFLVIAAAHSGGQGRPAASSTVPRGPGQRRQPEQQNARIPRDCGSGVAARYTICRQIVCSICAGVGSTLSIVLASRWRDRCPDGSGGPAMRRHGSGRLRMWLGDLRLPADERRAAKAERRAEDEIRRERDWSDEHGRQRAAADAEARRNLPYRY